MDGLGTMFRRRAGANCTWTDGFDEVGTWYEFSTLFLFISFLLAYLGIACLLQVGLVLR